MLHKLEAHVPGRNTAASLPRQTKQSPIKTPSQQVLHSCLYPGRGSLADPIFPSSFNSNDC